MKDYIISSFLKNRPNFSKKKLRDVPRLLRQGHLRWRQPEFDIVKKINK